MVPLGAGPPRGPGRSNHRGCRKRASRDPSARQARGRRRQARATSGSSTPGGGYLYGDGRPLGPGGGGGPSGPPPEPPPGGEGWDPSDQYLRGGLDSSRPPNSERMAEETYWNLRKSVTSVRLWMTYWWMGQRKGDLYDNLWLCDKTVNVTLEDAWKRGGRTEIDMQIRANDVVQHALSTTGAQVSYLITRDDRARAEALTYQPPGKSHVLPEREVVRTREASKQVFQQAWRAEGKGGYGPGPDDDEGGKGALRRRRKGAGAAGEKRRKAAPKGDKCGSQPAEVGPASAGEAKGAAADAQEAALGAA